MGAIQLLRKLQALESRLDDLIRESFAEIEPFLVDLNLKQLDKGEDSQGRFLGTYRPTTYEYAQRNGRPKKQPDINLLDTGAFRNAISAHVVGNSLIMESSDSKNSMLVERYGNFIIGIPEDEMKTKVAEKLYSVLFPKIIQVLKNA